MCERAFFFPFRFAFVVDMCAISIDVTDIKFVINFDFPNNTEDYVHRIGRTARAKRTGTAYSFFTSSNSKQAKELVEILKEAGQKIEPRLYEMIQMAKQMSHLKGVYQWQVCCSLFSKLVVCII